MRTVWIRGVSEYRKPDWENVETNADLACSSVKEAVDMLLQG